MAGKRPRLPRALIKSAAGKKFGGAYILYGPDEYIKSETARRAVDAHVPAEERTFSVTHLTAGSTDAAEILAAAQAVPLLGNRIAVIVHDAGRLASVHKAKLTAGLEAVTHPALLLFIGPPQPDTRTKFYAWFVENGRAVICEPLTEAQAEQWAAREFATVEKSVSAEVLTHLLTLTGPDAGILAQEVAKLALYVGDRSDITRDDVDTVVGHARGFDLAEFVELQLAGDTARVLHSSRGLTAGGAEPATLIGRLAAHYFDLYRALLSGEKSAWKLAGALRIPRGRAERLSRWGALTSREKVEGALEQLADADALVKSGRADPTFVFDALSLALANGNTLKPLGFE